jgi:mono/diheme cytochrome c family protein
MDAINHLLTAPGLKFLQLLPTIIFFMMMFHLPYMAMVLGSSVLSVVFDKFKPGVSKDFLRLALGKGWVWIGFGVLPSVSLAMLYKIQLYNTPVPIHFYILRLVGLMAVGFIMLGLYRLKGHILLGAVGVLSLMVYCFHFINVLSLLIFPEKWPYLEGPLPFPLFSITPLIHFGGFLFLTLMATGAGIIFFYYRWPEKRLAEDCPHYDFMKYTGYGLLLAGALLMPVIILWDLYNLPTYSLSVGVFVLSGLIVVVVTGIAAAAASMIRHKDDKLPRHGVTALLLVLVLFGLMIGKDRMLRANASLETVGVLEMDAQKVQKEWVAQREELYAKNMVIDPKLGEQVYNDRCTACHSFEQKILGPPFNSVLPKYVQQPGELEVFLKNPKKIDPAYPSMPNPGLTTIQIKSVVKFLMGKMGADKGVNEADKTNKANPDGSVSPAEKGVQSE